MTIRTLIALSLISTSGLSHATGVPTVDGLTASQVFMVYNETLNQIQVAKDQLGQLGRMEQLATGSRGMGVLLNSLDLGIKIPAEFQTLLSNIEGSSAYKIARDAYPHFENQPKMNEIFNQRAINVALIDQIIEQTSKRSKNIANLMQQIDLAIDPAAKTDLTNRLVSEQNAIAADSQMVSSVNEKMKQENARLQYQAKQESICKEFPRSC